MRTMTGMQVLDMYLKDAIREARATGLSPQEVFDNYDLSDIDPNKLYNVTTEYTDTSDEADTIYIIEEVE